MNSRKIKEHNMRLEGILNSIKGNVMDEKCSIGFCENSVRTKGMCQKHYMRVRRHGVPTRITPLERFMDKVAIDHKTKCWEWQGSKDQDGYATFRLDDNRIQRGSRASYTLMRGLIPEGLIVCHTCDNPGCVNPQHLFLGTHQDNTNDRENKGRGHRNWKEFCKYGHPMSEGNLYKTKTGRRCRQCVLNRSKK